MTWKDIVGKFIDLSKWVVIMLLVVEIILVMMVGTGLSIQFMENYQELRGNDVVTIDSGENCSLIGYVEVCPR